MAEQTIPLNEQQQAIVGLMIADAQSAEAEVARQREALRLFLSGVLSAHALPAPVEVLSVSSKEVVVKTPDPAEDE